MTYWRNVFILVNDDGCTLDAGRKSVTKDDLKRIRGKAVAAFNKLTKYHKKFIITTQTEAEKAVMDNLKEEARMLPDLRIGEVCYRKVPNYEQGGCSNLPRVDWFGKAKRLSKSFFFV